MTANPPSTDYIPKQGQVKHWTNAIGSSASVTLSRLTSEQNLRVLFVANDADNAYRIQNELRFFDPALEVRTLADLETLPYDTMSPQTDIISSRMATLAGLANFRSGVLVAAVRTLLHHLPPPSFMHSQVMSMKKGDEFDRESTRRALLSAGYREVDTVSERGQFAVRGGVFDLFASGFELPVRMELFDTEIERLRTFDLETQLTIEELESIEYLPTKEFPIDELGIRTFRNNWHYKLSGSVTHCPDYQDVSKGIIPEGIESYQSLFFNDMSTIFDYLHEGTVVVLDDGVIDGATTFATEVQDRYEKHRFNPSRPLLDPSELYLDFDQLRSLWNDYARVVCHNEDYDQKHAIDLHGEFPPTVAANHRLNDPIAKFRQFIEQSDDSVILIAESAGRLQYLQEFLNQNDLDTPIFDDWRDILQSGSTFGLTIGLLDRPTRLEGLWILTELELFEAHSSSTSLRKQKSNIDPDLLFSSLSEITLGSPVVHLDHGVGRYEGLEVLWKQGRPTECMVIQYANNAKVYAPATDLGLIYRYIGGDEDSAPLHKLGGDSWVKAKAKAHSRVQDVATELLSIYARRQLAKGIQYPGVSAEFHRFCSKCEFELTDDQLAATAAIIGDLTDTKPMDRLVCGDVGFGKTEVAMRAAFHVVDSGKQVAVLVPTTLLANQHFDSFLDRFTATPIHIDLLDSTRTAKEKREIREKLQAGTLDIVIGTHALLADGVEFKDLGLLIVDEEHRFGVRHKEKIRDFKTDIELLTLTATPIPRTLNMAIEDIKQLSLIATPPAKRLSIKTFCVERADALLSDAIQRELDRGGQVYYLWNRIDTIDQVADDIKKLVPRARIGIAHGTLPKRELNDVMSDFYHRRCNVLVTTTIIESGIDVPNANTILIDRADSFGLAQLHQLRGRVGRSHRQAYAYLLTEPGKKLDVKASKRLAAIEDADELGAGFQLALNDMEIRGAGELLGHEQSGEVESVGYLLYIEMLSRTVEQMRSGDTPNLNERLEIKGEVDFGVASLIPSDYVPDASLRLMLYKRMSSCKDTLELGRLQAEFIDRFGRLPPETENLFRSTRIKLQSEDLGISKVEFSNGFGKIHFEDYDRFDVNALFRLQALEPKTYSFVNDSTLGIDKEFNTAEDRFTFVEELINDLSLPAEAA